MLTDSLWHVILFKCIKGEKLLNHYLIIQYESDQNRVLVFSKDGINAKCTITAFIFDFKSTTIKYVFLLSGGFKLVFGIL